jgi:hypothetical protein
LHKIGKHYSIEWPLPFQDHSSNYSGNCQGLSGSPMLHPFCSFLSLSPVPDNTLL